MQQEGSSGSRPESPHAGGAEAEDTGWYAFLEDLLARSAEEAQGYRIMHEKAYKHYAKISTRLTIPAIILSTLTGVANFGQSSLEPYLGANAPLFIGALSIVAAIFSTIAKYLRADEKSELNRSAMVQWDKLHRMLVTVLTQPRGRRIEAQEFLLQYREERNRLAEQVPVIPYKIRTWFMLHYGQQYNPGIQRPGILNLADVPVYRAVSPTDDGPTAAGVAPTPRNKKAAAAPAPAPRGASPSPSPPIGSRMAAVSSHFLPARGNSPSAGAAGSRLAQVLQAARMRQESGMGGGMAAGHAASSPTAAIAARAVESAATAAATATASAVEKATTRAVTDALGRITRDFRAGISTPTVAAASRTSAFLSRASEELQEELQALRGTEPAMPAPPAAAAEAGEGSAAKTLPSSGLRLVSAAPPSIDDNAPHADADRLSSSSGSLDGDHTEDHTEVLRFGVT